MYSPDAGRHWSAVEENLGRHDTIPLENHSVLHGESYVIHLTGSKAAPTYWLSFAAALSLTAGPDQQGPATDSEYVTIAPGTPRPRRFP